jgi:hypothetical protein
MAAPRRRHRVRSIRPICPSLQLTFDGTSRQRWLAGHISRDDSDDALPKGQDAGHENAALGCSDPGAGLSVHRDDYQAADNAAIRIANRSAAPDPETVGGPG